MGEMSIEYKLLGHRRDLLGKLHRNHLKIDKIGYRRYITTFCPGRHFQICHREKWQSEIIYFLPKLQNKDTFVLGKQTTVSAKTRRIILLEILWITGASILALIVMAPIYAHAREFPFYLDNFIFVFALFTYARFMFFVSTSALTLHIGVKLFFLATAFPVTFLLLDQFNNFRTYIDNHGTQPIFGHLSDQLQIQNDIYLKNEMVLFGVGSIVSSIIFPLFLVYSIWVFRNKGRHV